MKNSHCELFSQRIESFALLGKSIAFQKHRTNSNKSSINPGQCDINVNPMRHSQRIKQLFLPVCSHEIKHEIANHWRDVQNKKAAKTRTKARRSLPALCRLRKKQKISKLIATTTAIMHRRGPTLRRCLSNKREVLQIPSFTFPRAILQNSTVNERKGRQTLCKIHRPNDIASVDLIEKRFTIPAIDRFIESVHKKRPFIKPFASLETATNRINHPNVNFKFLSSAGCRQSVQHKAQTCRKRSERKTCTTNQSHVETKTLTTKTPAPNCNNNQQRKTYRCNDGNRDCINIDTNKTEWYIQLASNCYRNGFELHVNHLDECSKKPSVFDAKAVPTPAPATVAFLRLPSSALFCHSERTQFDLSSEAVSLFADLVVCSSPKSVRVAPHIHDSGSKYSTSNLCSDKTHRRPHQLNTTEIKRINHKNSAQSCKSFQLQLNQPIDETTALPIIDTAPIAQQSTETEPLNALNAKNNMNSVAVDANNLPQNLQLSCQAIQYNYPNNNNLTFYREYQANGQPEPPTIAESSNYRNHWIDNSSPNSIALNNRIEVRSTAAAAPETGAATVDIVNDLIEAFNSSFDVSDTNQIKLPQIILSDFSSDLPTPPPTTPLFFATKPTTVAEPFSEHQLQEFQLSKRLQQPINTIVHNTNLHTLGHHSF